MLGPLTALAERVRAAEWWREGRGGGAVTAALRQVGGAADRKRRRAGHSPRRRRRQLGGNASRAGPSGPRRRRPQPAARLQFERLRAAAAIGTGGEGQVSGPAGSTSAGATWRVPRGGEGREGHRKDDPGTPADTVKGTAAAGNYVA